MTGSKGRVLEVLVDCWSSQRSPTKEVSHRWERLSRRTESAMGMSRWNELAGTESDRVETKETKLVSLTISSATQIKSLLAYFEVRSKGFVVWHWIGQQARG